VVEANNWLPCHLIEKVERRGKTDGDKDAKNQGPAQNTPVLFTRRPATHTRQKVESIPLFVFLEPTHSISLIPDCEVLDAEFLHYLSNHSARGYLSFYRASLQGKCKGFMPLISDR
jgi:hypothetical protein